MAASSIPEPAGCPTQSEATVAVAGLPTPIRLLPPPVAKAAPGVMQPGSKAFPTKGPPPGKSMAVHAAPEKNPVFDHAVSLQQVPASPDLADPHGSLLF